MTNPFSIWVYLSATPLLWLALTLVAWIAADAIARACGRHLLVNPVLIAIAAMGAVLMATGTPYETYFQGAQFVHFLLGPATVAIAVPLVRHRTLVRAQYPADGRRAAGRRRDGGRIGCRRCGGARRTP
jgi:putative effector of murein hydrolase